MIQKNCFIHGVYYSDYCSGCMQTRYVDKNDDVTSDLPATPAQGLKYDQEKPRMDLLDPEFLEQVAMVLGFGAKKYEAHNWRGGINYSRLIGAAYRHLGAINRGEDIDAESGLPHTAHLGCCVMFLAWMMNHRKDLDDRYKET